MPRLARFSVVVIAANIAVILWGAYVRATGSGAGCGAHWPLCNGELLPRPEAAEMLVELTHRITSGIAFVLVFALLIAVRRTCPVPHPARSAAAASMVLIVTEAALGAGLVLFELVAENDSLARAFSMAAHLLNTYLLLAALTLTTHYLWGHGPVRWRQRDRTYLYPALALVAMLVVGASGAVTALGDTLFPASTLEQAVLQDFSPTAHLLVRLRVIHPLVAVATALLVVSLPQLVGRARHSANARRWGGIASLLALTQLGLGAVNVTLLAPVWLQLVHLLAADAVWMALVLYVAHLLAAEPDRPE